MKVHATKRVIGGVMMACVEVEDGEMRYAHMSTADLRFVVRGENEGGIWTRSEFRVMKGELARREAAGIEHRPTDEQIAAHRDAAERVLR